jgi:hypothetical protein
MLLRIWISFVVCQQWKWKLSKIKQIYGFFTNRFSCWFNRKWFIHCIFPQSKSPVSFNTSAFFGTNSFNPGLEQTPSYLHTFSQKVKCEWKNFGRKFFHINHLKNVSSSLFQNMLSGLPDYGLEQTSLYLHTFSQKVKCEWKIFWRRIVHISHLKNVSSNLCQNMLSGSAEDSKNPKWQCSGWMS